MPRSGKNRYLPQCRKKVRLCGVGSVDRAAGRDNFRDNQKEIWSRVTRALPYT
jgi:hypothetical protein